MTWVTTDYWVAGKVFTRNCSLKTDTAEVCQLTGLHQLPAVMTQQQLRPLHDSMTAIIV